MTEGARNDRFVDGKGCKILYCACYAEIAYINEFPDVLPYKTFHIQVLIQYAAVVDDDSSDIAVTEPAGDSNVARKNGQPLPEEEIRLSRAQEKRIIIEEYKML